MQLNCYVCSKLYEKNVPLLVCNHYVCPECYCNMKSKKVNECIICNKKLLRKQFKNKNI